MRVNKKIALHLALKLGGRYFKAFPQNRFIRVIKGILILHLSTVTNSRVY